jgi:hypothetical protein
MVGSKVGADDFILGSVDGAADDLMVDSKVGADGFILG